MSITRCLLTIVLTASLSAAQVPATTPKKPGSVAGAVTNSVTKAPVKSATVTLHNSRQRFAYIAVSDAAGVFRFQNVEPAGETVSGLFQLPSASVC